MLRDRFRPTDAIDDIEARGINRFAAVPTMLRAMPPELAARQAYTGDAISGGEILPPGVVRGRATGGPRARLWDFFGLTGTCAYDFIVRPQDCPEAAGSIGRTMPGIACRIDPESGELAMRSPYRILGHFGRSGLTAAAFDGGWFRTGDGAETRGDGRITLTGRLKDLIIRGGNKISPIEIERAAEACPGVAAALATEVPARESGEAIHLYLAVRDGDAVTTESLRAWLGARLDPFKLRDRLHLGASLPTGATGKADCQALRRLGTARDSEPRR